jgi:hypothetical protein
MGLTKTPPQLESIHVRGGNCLVIDLGHSVPFCTEVKERV